jgi:hypothetical protein
MLPFTISNNVSTSIWFAFARLHIVFLRFVSNILQGKRVTRRSEWLALRIRMFWWGNGKKNRKRMNCRSQADPQLKAQLKISEGLPSCR